MTSPPRDNACPCLPVKIHPNSSKQDHTNGDVFVSMLGECALNPTVVEFLSSLDLEEFGLANMRFSGPWPSGTKGRRSHPGQTLLIGAIDWTNRAGPGQDTSGSGGPFRPYLSTRNSGLKPQASVLIRQR